MAKFFMISFTKSIEVATRGKGTYEITDQVLSLLAESGLRDGVCTVFIAHTSASLVIFENADATARRDLHEYFERLCPEGVPCAHDLEGPDDMPAHLRMVLTRTSEVVPVVSGRLALGTWQGIFVFEHRRAPHRRRVTVNFLGIGAD